jgi:predicted AlkP superfamily pyrophosphatase or phosphodiesterase
MLRPAWPILLALASACASRPRSPVGSETAAPTTIVLVSIDGFRPADIGRPGAANLRALAARGVRARWMSPVFPSKTYPNHYTIATGLRPERHGVVANAMWDSAIGYRFVFTSARAVSDSRWWGGEPIWVTAERQGRRAAAFFWPGTEAAIGGVRPTWWHRYDGAVPNARRVAQVLEWLSLPPDSAPGIILLYFNDVDWSSHEYGPDAPETDSAIARVDTALGSLMDGIAARGASGRANLMVVSDHGMAALAPERTIYLDDYIDLATVDVIEWSPVAALAPRGTADAAEVHRRLRGRHPHLAVYRREEVPERLHYRNHPRIAPVLALADEGWTITSRARAAAARRWQRGTHGYDPALPSMRALFVAQGPAFRAGSVVEPFGNVHLYELMCAVLGLRPAPNEGRLDSVKAVLRLEPEAR